MGASEKIRSIKRPSVSAEQAQQEYKVFINSVNKRVANKPDEFRAYINACLDQLQDRLEELGVL